MRRGGSHEPSKTNVPNTKQSEKCIIPETYLIAVLEKLLCVYCRNLYASFKLAKLKVFRGCSNELQKNICRFGFRFLQLINVLCIW